MTIVKTKGGNSIHCDFDKEFSDMKQQQQQQQEKKSDDSGNMNKKDSKSDRFGDRAALDAKTKEIAMKEDENWILAIIDGDNMGKFKAKYGKDATHNEIIKIGDEIDKLCQILDPKKYIAFKLSGGDEYAMLLFDNKNSKECILPAKEIIQQLIENVASYCKVTISVGFARLMVKENELADEWRERANKYLEQAKENGKNQSCWVGKAYTAIEMQRVPSVQQDVCCFFCLLFFCFFVLDWSVIRIT